MLASAAIAVLLLAGCGGDDGGAAVEFKTASTASPDAQARVTSGAIHGVPLVIEGGDAKLREAFFAFLAKYAPV
jgi:hypothetical protein